MKRGGGLGKHVAGHSGRGDLPARAVRRHATGRQQSQRTGRRLGDGTANITDSNRGPGVVVLELGESESMPRSTVVGRIKYNFAPPIVGVRAARELESEQSRFSHVPALETRITPDIAGSGHRNAELGTRKEFVTSHGRSHDKSTGQLCKNIVGTAVRPDESSPTQFGQQSTLTPNVLQFEIRGAIPVDIQVVDTNGGGRANRGIGRGDDRPLHDVPRTQGQAGRPPRQGQFLTHTALRHSCCTHHGQFLKKMLSTALQPTHNRWQFHQQRTADGHPKVC